MLRLGRAEFKGAKRGAVATEYAILLALIGVVSIVAVVAAGKDVKRVYCEAASAIAHANGRAFWLCDEAEPLSEELVAEEDAIAEKPEDCAEGCVFAGFGSGKVAKLSTDGQYLWESDTLTSKVYAVASDKEGNIYAGGEDYVLVKLDPSGKELWRADTFAAVMTIAVSDDGFVYVGTGSGHSSVRKFRTSDGMVMATERVATPVSVDNGRDWIVGVTVSKSGFVYAATKYGAIAKLDPNGEMTTLWQEEATQAYLGDLDIDDTGNLYTVGSTIDSREADMGRDEEAFMLVEDATARYGINSNTNLAGQFFGAALSPNGDYAVIGWRQWPDGDYGTYVTNMRPGMGSNPNKWTAEFYKNTANVRTIDFDKAGDLYVANESGWIRKLNGTNGEELAFWEFPSSAWAVHVSGKSLSKGPAGSTVVADAVPPVAGAGTCSANCPYVGLSNGEVIKIGDNGSPVWTSADSKSTINGMQWLADGSVITGASDGKVRKHDPNGNVVWTHASGAGSIYDVLATRDGSIVIAGQGGLVRKLTADGEVVSTRYVKSVMSTKANTDYAKSLDLGPTGDVFVLSAQGAFARINPAGDMTVLWRDEMGLEYADRIEVANDGIMYLTTYQYDSTQADKYIYDMVFGIREAGNAREIAFLQDQPSGAIFASALNKSNNRIAVADWTYNGGFKPVVRMIEPNATTPQKWSSTRPTGVVQDMSFNKDYSILFAGGSDNMLRKFNPANGADLGSYTFGSRVMSVEIGH